MLDVHIEALVDVSATEVAVWQWRRLNALFATYGIVAGQFVAILQQISGGDESMIDICGAERVGHIGCLLCQDLSGV